MHQLRGRTAGLWGEHDRATLLRISFPRRSFILVSYATLAASRRDLRTISLVVGQVSHLGGRPSIASSAARSRSP